MTDDRELRHVARSVLKENLYAVLGTADRDGRPWVSPVFYTLAGYGELSWISEPGAWHSRNIAVRPEVSLVVFDSRVPVGGATAVYMCGVAAEVSGAAIAAAAARYNEASLAKGGQAVDLAEVSPGGRFRLYRATVGEHWLREPRTAAAGRVPVTP